MASPLRLARLVTMPQTRHLVMAAGRSSTLRELGRRARTDRAGLARDLRHTRVSPAAMRDAIRHPATRELADVGMLLLPGRYLPMGWAAARIARRLMRPGRSGAGPAKAPWT